VVENARRIVAIELFAAAQAAELRLRSMPGARLGAGTTAALAAIRQRVPFVDQDQLYGPHLDALTEMIQAGAFSP
jgi:histidine ammonia-lyase